MVRIKIRRKFETVANPRDNDKYEQVDITHQLGVVTDTVACLVL